MSATNTTPPPVEHKSVAAEQVAPETAPAPTNTSVVESPPLPAATVPAQITEQKEQKQELASTQAAPIQTASPGAGTTSATTGPVTVNVTQQSAPAPPVTVVQLAPIGTGSGLFVRALWFLLIGWWAGYIWALTALVLEWTIIGLPIALLMFNRLPKVMTLKPTPVTQGTVSVVQEGTATTVVVGPPTEVAAQPFWLRAVYFVLVGWWLSFVWLNLAYLVGITLIGLPLAFWMFNRIPAVTTLSPL